jgi:cytochrome c-type biogenesis protein CcsB
VTINLVYVMLAEAAVAYIVAARSTWKWMNRVGRTLISLSAVLLFVTLVLRGIAAGHWPLSNHYEFSLCFIWMMSVIYLIVEAYWRERRGGIFVALVLMVLMTYAVMPPTSKRAIGPLPPVLRSPWLQGHVLTVMVGYAAFGVAAGLSIMRLFAPATAADAAGAATDAAAGAPTGAAEGAEHWLPPADDIERMIRRLLAIGFPWLTLGILTGAIWAQSAWGRYWGWDPKESWALITWLWYLAILHIPSGRRRGGRRLAWLTLVGFGLVLFTFIGVPILSERLSLYTLHGY